MNTMLHTNFKSKWNSIKTWFSMPDLNRRRPSECSTASTCTMTQDTPFSLMDISSYRKAPFADIKHLSSFHKPTVDQVMALYHLAVDELNYAEDSLGSPYYRGDRLAAKEAIENFEQAYALLSTDQIMFEITDLKLKLNSLPLVQEEERSSL